MRKSFSGASRKAAVAVTFDDDPGTLTVVGDDLTGWPTGANGPFVATVGRATSFEEKVLVTNRVGNQLNLASRGYDSTVARNHASGSDLEHTWDSIEADLLNRLANLLSTKGSIFVYDGANIVELVPGTANEVLEAVPAGTYGVEWRSRLIPVAASAPAYLEGERYYDTTYDTLMVGVDGTYVPAAQGVFVFANAAARNSVLGATNTPTGRLAYLVDVERLTLAVGVSGWQELPKPGEWAVHYANEAAVTASTLATNSLAIAEDTGQLYLKRPTTGWVAIGQRHTVEDGSGFPANPLEGDLHLTQVG